MKIRWILIISLVALVLTAGLLYLRHVKIVRREYEPPRIRVRPVAKKPARAKVAVVIDDFGYNKNNLGALFEIDMPATLSILPRLRYSTEIAILGRARGYEVILHLPLEPHRKDAPAESDTIKTGMSDKEVLAKLEEEIASLPGLRGVSNHQGSKATEDRALMTIILQHLKKKNLYFFDSLTSEKSICRDVAAKVGLRYARRDIFLDNINKTDYIERELMRLKRLAFKKGRAIAICHDRKNTIAALARMMPEMAKEGIEFVPLSEMVIPPMENR